jgi:hypothetical protein
MLRTISIDFDIHRLIEQERRGFDEPEHLALRRLLKLPDLVETPVQTKGSEGLPWMDMGVTIPHGTKAMFVYGHGRQQREGQFLDGKLVVDGQSFDALSPAAAAVARTRDGRKVSLNGWLYWHVMLPGEHRWTRMIDLRK